MLFELYLTALCHYRQWASPQYVIFKAQDGYTCEVQIDNEYYRSGGTSWYSELRARDAAGMVAFLALRKASSTFLPTTVKKILTDRRDAHIVDTPTGTVTVIGYRTRRKVEHPPWSLRDESWRDVGQKWYERRTDRRCAREEVHTLAIFGSCARFYDKCQPWSVEEALEQDSAQKPDGGSKHCSTISDAATIDTFNTAATIDTFHTVATIDTFHTASTIDTFHTAGSRQRPAVDNGIQTDLPKAITSSWLRFLSERNLVPEMFDQTDWSGRGQHAEFKPDEDAVVENLLQVKHVIGHTSTAVVEKVQCKRIMLARKKIRCNRRLRREEAVEEVAHLQRLSHAHVIRGVGTYIIRKDFAILLYPATRHNLESFLDECSEIAGLRQPSPAQQYTLRDMLQNVRRFFECLTHTLSFIHGRFTKHMDIKPSNFLIQDKRWRSDGYRYKIYVADFGISRAYAKAVDAETDSFTSFTKAYAAPEVVRQDKRGFSADIFSLGCVFLELLAVLRTPMQRDTLIEIRKTDSKGDKSYQANIERLLEGKAFSELDFIDDRCYKWLEVTRQMVDENPTLRPSATRLKETFGAGQDCCFMAPEPFEAVGQDPLLFRSSQC